MHKVYANECAGFLDICRQSLIVIYGDNEKKKLFKNYTISADPLKKEKREKSHVTSNDKISIVAP